mmetsp:Transcript_10696/g.44852  ORF Transcript_10696/g.44852 Transcript_10696/m.44852 type:complete len:399 (-) Transcript_10696:1374-2570(-)
MVYRRGVKRACLSCATRTETLQQTQKTLLLYDARVVVARLYLGNGGGITSFRIFSSFAAKRSSKRRSANLCNRWSRKFKSLIRSRRLSEICFRSSFTNGSKSPNTCLCRLANALLLSRAYLFRCARSHERNAVPRGTNVGSPPSLYVSAFASRFEPEPGRKTRPAACTVISPYSSKPSAASTRCAATSSPESRASRSSARSSSGPSLRFFPDAYVASGSKGGKSSIAAAFSPSLCGTRAGGNSTSAVCHPPSSLAQRLFTPGGVTRTFRASTPHVYASTDVIASRYPARQTSSLSCSSVTFPNRNVNPTISPPETATREGSVSSSRTAPSTCPWPCLATVSSAECRSLECAGAWFAPLYDGPSVGKPSSAEVKESASSNRSCVTVTSTSFLNRSSAYL